MFFNSVMSSFARCSRNYHQDYNMLIKIIRNPNESEITEKVLKEICNILQYHVKDKRMVNITCHLISSLALNEQYATCMIQNNVLKSLKIILARYKGDGKLIWFATSCIWNLTRPADISSYIPRKLPLLIFDCLTAHVDNENVIHTCIGALSNLAISCDTFFNMVNKQKLKIILDVVTKYIADSNICSHVAAFVANAAVNMETAEMILECGYVTFLLTALNFHRNEPTLTKHVISGLHNLADLQEFPRYFCHHDGYEVIKSIQNKSEEIQTLVHNMFNVASMPTTVSSSLQIAIIFGYTREVLSIIKKKYNHIDINHCDTETNSCLYLAIQNERSYIVKILMAMGAEVGNKELELISSIENDTIREYKMAMHSGHQIHKKAVKTVSTSVFDTINKHKTTVKTSIKTVCSRDIANLITNYISGVDLLMFGMSSGFEKLSHC